MYILIHIGNLEIESVELCSKSKSKLVSYLKEKNYYYSKQWDRYINDKYTCEGGYGGDYIIDKIDEI